MLRQVDILGGRKGKKELLENIELSNLLKRLGEQQEFDMPFRYINLTMFETPCRLKLKGNPIIPDRSWKGENKFIRSISVKLEYEIEEVCIKSRFENNDSNIFFEKIAFDLLSDDYKSQT